MTGLGSCLLLLLALLVIAGVVLVTLPAPQIQSQADLTWATLLHHERQTWKRCFPCRKCYMGSFHEIGMLVHKIETFHYSQLGLQ